MRSLSTAAREQPLLAATRENPTAAVHTQDRQKKKNEIKFVKEVLIFMDSIKTYHRHSMDISKLKIPLRIDSILAYGRLIGQKSTKRRIFLWHWQHKASMKENAG